MKESEPAQTSLFNVEENLRAIFDVIKDGVVVTHQGVIQFSNPRMAEMLKVEGTESIIGKNFLDYFTPESMKIAAAYIQKHQAQIPDARSIFECELVRTDGS
ncbi:MAG: PAS domain-containing protein, partial [Chloroflexota bacterium]